jgi:hypothetical protein
MHPLDGPRVKVERAKSQIVTLQACLQGFFKRYPYRVVVAEFDRKAGCYSLRVESTPPAFPNEWGVFIGEIAHNLRSALDGLAWQLALLETGVPYGRTAFPIYLVGHTRRKTDAGTPFPSFWDKRDEVRELKSVPRSLWTRIEAFQPYKRGNGGRHSPLFLLHKLNNTDKHRLITVVAATVSGMQVSGLSGGSTLKVGVPLHLNAKVGSVCPLPAEGVRVLDIVNDHVQIEDGRIRTRIQCEVQVNTNITPGIRFGDSCDAVERLPVIRTLQRMANEVSRIIESFAGEF